MKVKRSTKEYGSGSGIGVFESELFRVVMWHMEKGVRTTIECKLFNEYIHFDGKHKFVSDKKCMEQLELKDILHMIEYQKELSFEEGSQSKVNEIKKCLEI